MHVSAASTLMAMLCPTRSRVLSVPKFTRWSEITAPYSRKALAQALRVNPYSQAMVELLATGPVEIPASEVPPQLRRGKLGSIARARCSVQHTLRDHSRGKLGIRRRLDAWATSRRLLRADSSTVDGRA
jgi:hypothetical protein